MDEKPAILQRNGSKRSISTKKRELIQIISELQTNGLMSKFEGEKRRTYIDSMSPETDEEIIKVAECQDDAEFLKMFLITEQEVVLEYSAVKKDHSNDERVVKLLKMLQNKGQLVPLVSHIVQDELQHNRIGILREESFGGCLLKNFWFRLEGRNYLKTLVKPLVKATKAVTKSRAIELLPERVGDPAVLKENIEIIMNLSKNFINTFTKSFNQFPPVFEGILRTFYELLTEIEGLGKAHLGLGFSEAALRLFGGFLTLRFICPAVVSPHKYQLVTHELPTPATRVLILVSKILQNIANQVEFDGEKEAYMLPFNEYVLQTTPSMMAFVSALMDNDHVRRLKPGSEIKRHKSFRSRMSQIITDFAFKEKDAKGDKPEEVKNRYIVDAPMQLPNLPIRPIAEKKLCYSTTGPDEDGLHQQLMASHSGDSALTAADAVPQEEVVAPKEKAPCAISCNSISTYPLFKDMTRDGDPIADHFCVRATKDNICAAVADGCNWGKRAQQAAQRSATAFVDYLLTTLHTCRSIPDVGNALLLAVSAGHTSITEGYEDIWNAGTTSLVGGVMLRMDMKGEKDKKYAFVFITIGNCKAFLRAKDGSVEDLTPLHGNAPDHRDPGGRIGPYLEEGAPDLRNLKIQYAKCEEGDIVMLCSSGVSDNFDPAARGLTPKDLDKSLEMDEWSQVTEPSQTANEVRNAYRARLISETLQKSSAADAEAVTKTVLHYCEELTTKARTFMEENTTATQPRDKKEYPGKFAHTTCVSFVIGELPYKPIHSTLRGKKKQKSAEKVV